MPFETIPLPQYRPITIALIWVVVAIPMPILAFFIAPWASAAFGFNPLIMLWVSMILGMVWQCVVACILLRAEAGEMRGQPWRQVLAQRFWVQTPRDPATGRPSLWLLLWVVPVIAAGAAIELTGLSDLLATPLLWAAPWLASVPEPRLEGLAKPEFVGAWSIVAMGLVSSLFNYVLGEELLFHGVLLPRMRGACGRWDWAVNAVMFGSYHLIRPLTIPAIILSTMVWTYPTRRFRSTWFTLIPHALEGAFVMAMLIGLVSGLMPLPG